MTGLSMAFFQVHQPDVQALKEQMLSDGKIQEEIDQLPFSYFKKKCVSDCHISASQLVISVHLSLLACHLHFVVCMSVRHKFVVVSYVMQCC